MVSNCVEFHEVADFFDDRVLLEKCDKFIPENVENANLFAAFARSEKFHKPCIDFAKSACVPIVICTSPVAISSRIFFASSGGVMRDNTPIFMGNPVKYEEIGRTHHDLTDFV